MAEPTVRMTRTAWFWAFVCRECNFVATPEELVKKEDCPICSAINWRNALVRKTTMTDPKPWWDVFSATTERCSYEERDAKGDIWLSPRRADGENGA